MARQRFIHPGIWGDPTFGALSDSERVLFVGLFSNADDEGRIVATPSYLRSLLWPYDEKNTGAKVRKLRDTVVARFKALHLYEVDGVEYLAFEKWNDYQKPKYPSPSKLPSPPTFPEPSPNVPGILEEASAMPSPLDRAGFGKGTTSSNRSTTTRAREDGPTGLPFEKDLLATRLVSWIGSHSDEGTPGVVRSLASHLNEGQLAKILESTQTASPANRAGYVVNALKDERTTVAPSKESESKGAAA